MNSATMVTKNALMRAPTPVKNRAAVMELCAVTENKANPVLKPATMAIRATPMGAQTPAWRRAAAMATGVSSKPEHDTSPNA